MTSCRFSGLAGDLAEAELEADDAAGSVELLVGASGASSSHLVGVRLEGDPERPHEGCNESGLSLSRYRCTQKRFVVTGKHYLT